MHGMFGQLLTVPRSCAQRCRQRFTSHPGFHPGIRRDLSSGAHARPDHLTRTATEPRQEVVTAARIVAVREVTPSVRELILDVADKKFTFRAGNWVDFIIPEVDKVGGYSMCSTPAELPTLRLAVKRSTHPPAAWCHSAAAVPGAVVELKAGGKFAWDAALDGTSTEHLLLVAGGIGITSLLSIFQEAVQASAELVPNLKRISLLYSASRPSELAYRTEIERIASRDSRVNLVMHVTRNTGPVERWTGVSGRIDKESLTNALAGSQDGVVAFVCGPPAMTDDLLKVLRDEIGLPPENVRFERWW